MRILTISLNAWNDTMATGNTFSNFFKNLKPEDQIANIYCRDENINNKICKLYFKVTERDQIIKIFDKSHCGSVFKYSHVSLLNTPKKYKSNNLKQILFGLLQKIRPSILLYIREFLWDMNIWKSQCLFDFLKDFHPDIIYMHGHNNIYMHKLLWYCQKVTNAKVAVFFGDDMYNDKGETFLKKKYHKRYQKQLEFTINNANILFGGSPKLVEEYGSIFGRQFNLLIKSCDSFSLCKDKNTSCPITLMYAGNLLYGRDSVLKDVANIIQLINKDRVIFQMHIYSASYTDTKTKKILNDGINSFLHAPKNFSEICHLLNQTDLALFVESFDERYKKQTRLSFSTKIIDYFQADTAILTYGPADVSSIDYLLHSKVSFTATSFDELKEVLN